MSLYQALICLGSGQVQQAETMLREAITMQPNSGASKYLTLAQVLGRQEAVAALNGGIEIMKQELQQQAGIQTEQAAESVDDLRSEIAHGLCSVAEVFMTDLCDDEAAQDTCIQCVQQAR